MCPSSFSEAVQEQVAALILQNRSPLPAATHCLALSISAETSGRGSVAVGEQGAGPVPRRTHGSESPVLVLLKGCHGIGCFSQPSWPASGRRALAPIAQVRQLKGNHHWRGAARALARGPRGTSRAEADLRATITTHYTLMHPPAGPAAWENRGYWAGSLAGRHLLDSSTAACEANILYNVVDLSDPNNFTAVVTINNNREVVMSHWQLVWTYDSFQNIILAGAEGAISLTGGSPGGAPVRLVDSFTTNGINGSA